MSCNQCHGRLVPKTSDFPGFDLLACEDCGRPVRLIIPGEKRLSGSRPGRRGDVNRALRAARRFQQRGMTA